MNLFTYHRDLQSEANEVLGNVIPDKGLRVSTDSSSWDTFCIENDHCEVVLKSSEDYFEIFCRFSMKGEAPKRVFDLDAFLVASLGLNHSAKRPNTSYDEEAFGIWLVYYRTILEQYMDRPFKGDTSWVSAYDKWVDDRDNVDAFLLTFPFGDPNVGPIFKKAAQGDDTWVEDGKRLYKEIHGKEME